MGANTSVFLQLAFTQKEALSVKKVGCEKKSSKKYFYNNFKVLSVPYDWRPRAHMSIRFQYLLTVDLLEEGVCFLEACFLETKVFNMLSF